MRIRGEIFGSGLIQCFIIGAMTRNSMTARPSMSRSGFHVQVRPRCLLACMPGAVWRFTKKPSTPDQASP